MEEIDQKEAKAWQELKDELEKEFSKNKDLDFFPGMHDRDWSMFLKHHREAKKYGEDDESRPRRKRQRRRQ